ncbi:hypothetical protein [Vibrio rhizosphaerae]|nr:hypothetical protein [Vibrio rhizosphaerae]
MGKHLEFKQHAGYCFGYSQLWLNYVIENNLSSLQLIKAWQNLSDSSIAKELMQQTEKAKLITQNQDDINNQRSYLMGFSGSGSYAIQMIRPGKKVPDHECAALYNKDNKGIYFDPNLGWYFFEQNFIENVQSLYEKVSLLDRYGKSIELSLNLSVCKVDEVASVEEFTSSLRIG